VQKSCFGFAAAVVVVKLERVVAVLEMAAGLFDLREQITSVVAETVVLAITVSDLKNVWLLIMNPNSKEYSFSMSKEEN
jgi:hypothetical protein